MEAKELMINDWVMDKSPQQIKELGTQFCTNMDDDLLFTDRLKPLPLTKEILEANGWDVDKSDHCYEWLHLDENLTLMYYWHEHRLSKMYIGIDEWNNHQRVKDVLSVLSGLKYVHEFQQALRLFGLRELADNFKIL